MSKKVAIIHGFTEGPRHSRKFEAELRRQGFEVVKDPKKANVVLTHSAGCYVMPGDTEAEAAIVCGVPHWPGRALPSRLIKKTTGDFLGYKREHSTTDWLKKMNWNIYYFFRHPIRHGKMWRAYNASKEDFDINIPNVIVLRNQQDYFSNPGALTKLANNKGWRLLELPGQHDDIWENPADYIRFIDKLGPDKA